MCASGVDWCVSLINACFAGFFRSRVNTDAVKGRIIVLAAAIYWIFLQSFVSGKRTLAITDNGSKVSMHDTLTCMDNNVSLTTSLTFIKSSLSVITIRAILLLFEHSGNKYASMLAQNTEICFYQLELAKIMTDNQNYISFLPIPFIYINDVFANSCMTKMHGT